MVSGRGILWCIYIINRHLCIIRTYALPSSRVHGFTFLHYSIMLTWFYWVFSEEHIYINIFITVQHKKNTIWSSLNLLFSSIVSPHSFRHYYNFGSFQASPVHVNRISLHSSDFSICLTVWSIYAAAPQMRPCFKVQVALSH